MRVGHKGAENIFVVAVIVEVIRLHTRHDDNVGMKVEKVPPVFTGLGNEEILPARIGRHTVEIGRGASYEHRPGEVQVFHERTDHCGGRRLAVHPRYPEGQPPARERAQRLGVGNGWDTAVSSRRELRRGFRVVGRRVYDYLDTGGKRLCIEAHMNRYAEALEDGVGIEDFRCIAPGDLCACAHEHLSEGRHAGALDPDHEDRQVFELRRKFGRSHGRILQKEPRSINVIRPAITRRRPHAEGS